MTVSRNQLIAFITLIAILRYFYCDFKYYKTKQGSCYLNSDAAAGIKRR